MALYKLYYLLTYLLEKILSSLIGIKKTDPCCHGNENLGTLTQY